MHVVVEGIARRLRSVVVDCGPPGGATIVPAGNNFCWLRLIRSDSTHAINELASHHVSPGVIEGRLAIFGIITLRGCRR
jgi:hypothetical protein